MAVIAPKQTLLIGGILAAVLVLYVLGSEKRRNDAEPAANPNQCRVTVTADVLRVHDGPQLESKVVDRLTKGQETDADKVVQNGFRKLAENRWVSVDFARPLDGRDCG
jgi:hypothetical protein